MNLIQSTHARALLPAGTRRRALLAALAAAPLLIGAAFHAPRAHAQPAGAPVVRLIVPFAAGSYTDNVARIVAPAFGEKLGATITIDNRAGANGIIGADYVAKSQADGLTLLVGGASVNTINPGVYKSLPYDPERDLLPVVRIGLLPFLLLVNPGVPANNVSELSAYVKKNPGRLSYATPNAATLVGMETFKRSAGIDILSVPYKSSPQAMTDLVGNHVQVLIADFATAMPQVQAGKARLLAVTMAKRSALLPNVPTMAETVKNFDLTAWTGILAPGKLPREHALKISEAMNAALASPELRTRLAGIGFDVQPLGPDEFGPYLRNEIRAWGKLIKDAGIQPE